MSIMSQEFFLPPKTQCKEHIGEQDKVPTPTELIYICQ